MLNTLDCTSQGGNTGFGDCFLDPKNMLGAIIVPLGREYTPAETATAATMLAALQADILAAPTDRAYPIGGFEALTDNTEAPVKQTLGYGSVAITREGLYDLSFQFVKGGLCLSKSLRKFNGRAKAILLYDANGVLYGWKSGANMKGIPLDLFYQNPFKLNDGSNVTAYVLELAFKPVYLNDSPAFIKMDLADLVALEGLQDIVLSETNGSDGPIYILKAKVGCDGEDLYDAYDDELNDADMWLAFDADGAPITVSTVTKNAGKKAWNVTTAQAATYITLVSAADLADAGIDGYEALKLYPTNDPISGV